MMGLIRGMRTSAVALLVSVRGAFETSCVAAAIVFSRRIMMSI